MLLVGLQEGIRPVEISTRQKCKLLQFEEVYILEPSLTWSVVGELGQYGKLKGHILCCNTTLVFKVFECGGLVTAVIHAHN